MIGGFRGKTATSQGIPNDQPRRCRGRCGDRGFDKESTISCQIGRRLVLFFRNWRQVRPALLTHARHWLKVVACAAVSTDLSRLVGSKTSLGAATAPVATPAATLIALPVNVPSDSIRPHLASVSD
jgi:hypothetical protein